eukprot:1222104-Prymnesium_polylepis.1
MDQTSADLPDNGMLCWAMEDVRTLPFFHEPGAAPQPQDRGHKLHARLHCGHERQAPKPPAQMSDRLKRRHEKKRIAGNGGKD